MSRSGLLIKRFQRHFRCLSGLFLSPDLSSLTLERQEVAVVNLCLPALYEHLGRP